MTATCQFEPCSLPCVQLAPMMRYAGSCSDGVVPQVKTLLALNGWKPGERVAPGGLPGYELTRLIVSAWVMWKRPTNVPI